MATVQITEQTSPVVSLLTPESNAERLTKKLESLAKRARKLGLPFTWNRLPGTSTVNRVHSVYAEDENTGDRQWIRDIVLSVECARLDVSALPLLAGHTLLARLEHTEAGNVVCAAPTGHEDETIGERWRTAPARCEHCNTSRTRKDTFVLRRPESEGGALIQVGRNCLADYLRSGDPTKLLDEYFSVLAEADPDADFESWGGGAWDVSTQHYVAAALASVERDGFVKADACGCTTKDAASFLSGPCPTDHDGKKHWIDGQPTREQIERAETIVAWAQSLDPGASDYLHNLRVACTCRTADHKRRGILASAPSAYTRAMGKEAERKVRGEATALQHDVGYWGEVGKRVELEVTLIRERDIEGNYGAVTIRNFLTAEGHELVWFASSYLRHAPTVDEIANSLSVGRRVEIGEKVRVKATVKRHEKDRRTGRSQTIVTRVTVVTPSKSANQMRAA